MIGITEAANALEAARDLLEAEQITATFRTRDGDVKLIVDQDGLTVEVDGVQVPMREHVA